MERTRGHEVVPHAHGCAPGRAEAPQRGREGGRVGVWMYWRRELKNNEEALGAPRPFERGKAKGWQQPTNTQTLITCMCGFPSFPLVLLSNPHTPIPHTCSLIGRLARSIRAPAGLAWPTRISTPPTHPPFISPPKQHNRTRGAAQPWVECARQAKARANGAPEVEEEEEGRAPASSWGASWWPW